MGDNGGFLMVLLPFFGGDGFRPLTCGGAFSDAFVGVGDFSISSQFFVLGALVTRRVSDNGAVAA